AFPSAREDRRDLIGSESQPVPAGLNRLGHDDDTFIEQHARDPSDLLTRPTTTFDHAAPQAFEENRSGPLPPEQQGVGQMRSPNDVRISAVKRGLENLGGPALAKTAHSRDEWARPLLLGRRACTGANPIRGRASGGRNSLVA